MQQSVSLLQLLCGIFIVRAAVRLWSLKNYPESNEWHETFGIWGSHSGSDKNLNVPGYYTQSTGKTLLSFEGAYRFFSQNRELQQECPPFKGKAPCSFETSMTIYQSTRRNDPETLNVTAYTFQRSELFRCIRNISKSNNYHSHVSEYVCVSVRLSVCVKQLSFHWTDLLEIWYFSTLRKHVKKIQVSLKFDNNIA
jgi:hypothetical protein